MYLARLLGLLAAILDGGDSGGSSGHCRAAVPAARLHVTDDLAS